MMPADEKIVYTPDFANKVRRLMRTRSSKKLDSVYAQLDGDERPLFTNLLMDSGINPLEHLDAIPDYYAYGTSLYEELRVPSHIKSIGDFAFLNAGLIRVDTGENIESIGDGAFAANNKLDELHLDNNKTLKKIGRGAFSNCPNLGGTAIWDGIEEIDSQAFEFCTGMKKLYIYPSVKRIGDGAFFGCNLLKVWYYGTIEQFRKMRVHDTSLTHVYCFTGNNWALYKLH